MSVKELTGALRAADKNGNKQVLYPMTKIDLVDGLRDYLESLEVSKTVFGSLLAVDDSANLPFIGLNVYGKSTQKRTTGAQLWAHQKETELVLNGVTCTYEDGVYTLNGMSDMSFNFVLGTVSLENGAYTISANNPRHNGLGLQALVQVYSPTTALSLSCIDNTVDSYGTREMIASTDYDLRIRIEGGVTYDKFIIKPMLNKGSAVLPWELYTGGTPSPNPNVPQEIVNVGDVGSVDIMVYGKNLITNEWYQNMLFTEDGETVNSNNYWIYTKDYCKVDSDKSYVFSTDKPCRFAVYQYDENKAYLGFYQPLQSRTSAVCTFVPNCKYCRFGYNYNGSSETITPSEMGVKHWVQLEYGETATPYEPFTKQTFTIPTPNGLPGIKVTDAAMANYTDSDGNMWCCDEVDFGRGVYVKRIGEAVLDETSIPKLRNTYGSVLRFDFDTLKCLVKDNVGMCDSLSIGIIATPDLECFNTHGTAGHLIIQILSSRLATPDENGLLGYLATNPMTFHYILATPIETPLSESELAQYAAIHTNCPNTTVSNDKNADMSMTYYSERYDKAVDFIMSKIEDNQADIQAIKDVTEVTLLASNWSGSAAPYTQTVDVSGITEDDNPLLVSALYDGASLDAQKAYSKAFGIVSSGVAVVDNGSVTFKVYKLPVIDITVGLKGV